jgi:hypothetical protein
MFLRKDGIEVVNSREYDSSSWGKMIFMMEAVAMRNRLITTVAVVAGFLIASGPLFAHHGNAVFDVGKTVTMKGTVTEWFWANPHCFLSFDVKGDGGRPVHWVMETQAPPNMVPYGFSKQTFKPGDEVTVTLEPVKNGEPLGRLVRVVLANGKTLRWGG